MPDLRRHRLAQRLRLVNRDHDERLRTPSVRGGPAPIVVRLAVCPDENHWILKPQNSRLWYREFFCLAEEVLVFNVIILRTR